MNMNVVNVTINLKPFTAMTIDSNHRIDKPHNVGGFKETIQKICESPAVKKTKYEKILRDKHLS